MSVDDLIVDTGQVAPFGIEGLEPDEPRLRIDAARPSFGEAFSAGFERESWISLFTREAPIETGLGKPGFNPYDHVTEEELSLFPRAFADARSVPDVERIRRQIGREHGILAAMAMRPGAAFVGQALGGLLDPLMLIPVGGVAYRGLRLSNAARGALRVGTVGAASMAASELVLHQAQITRTFDESARNVAGGALIGGLLGGAATLVSRSARNAAARDAGKALGEIGGGSGSRLGDDITPAGRPPEGVAETGRRVTSQELKLRLNEKMARAMNLKFVVRAGRVKLLETSGLSPTIRLATASSDVVRAGRMKLFESSGVGVEGNVSGIAHGAVDVVSDVGAKADPQSLVGATGTGKIVQSPTAIRKIGSIVDERAEAIENKFGRPIQDDELAKINATLDEQLSAIDTAAPRAAEGERIPWSTREGTPVQRAEAFDALPGDAEVTLFHATSDANAANLIGGGKAVPQRQGRGIEAIDDGIYVGTDPISVEGMGPRILAVTVKKSQVSPSSEFLRTSPDGTAGRALVQGAATGGVVRGKPIRVEDVTDAGRYATAAEAPTPRAAEGAVPPGEPPVRIGDDVDVISQTADGEMLVVRTQDGREARVPFDSVDPGPGSIIRRTPAEGQTELTEALGRPEVVTAPGKRSAESIRKSFEPMRVNGQIHLEDGFSTYLTRLKGTDKAAVSRSEFYEKVGQAGDNIGAEIGTNERLALEGIEAEFPEALSIARKLKSEFYEPYLKMSQDLKILHESLGPETAPSYTTRVWDDEAIRSNPELLKQIARNWFRREFPEATADDAVIAANEIVSQLRRAPVGRVQLDPTDFMVSGRLQRRAFTVANTAVRDFLDHNALTKINNYHNAMSGDIAVAQAFGDVGASRWVGPNGFIVRSYDILIAEARNAKNANLARDLLDEQDKAIVDFQFGVDFLRGKNAPPSDSTLGVMRRVGRIGLNLNSARLLGGVVPTSIPDIGNIIMTHGISRSFGSSIQMLGRRLAGSTKNKQELMRLGRVVDATQDARIFENYGVSPREVLNRNSRTRANTALATAEDASSAIADFAFKVNLLRAWDRGVRSIAATATRERILDSVLKIQKSRARGAKLGRKLQKEADYMSGLGIGPDDWDVIADQFARHGETEGLHYLHTEDWDIGFRNVAHRMDDAIRSEAERIIVTPGAGDLPIAMRNNPVVQVITQFLAFPIAATNRIMLSGLQQGDAAFAQGLAASFSLAMLSTAIKDIASTGDIRERSSVEWAREGVDRMGFFGIHSDMANMLDKLNLGPALLYDGPVASRYAARSAFGSIMGPSFELGSDVLSALGAVGGSVSGRRDFTTSDLHGIRTMIPYQNLFYLRLLFDKIENSLSDQLSITGRRR